jgi:hypothetical protein
MHTNTSRTIPTIGDSQKDTESPVCLWDIATYSGGWCYWGEWLKLRDCGAGYHQAPQSRVVWYSTAWFSYYTNERRVTP